MPYPRLADSDLPVRELDSRFRNVRHMRRNTSFACLDNMPILFRQRSIAEAPFDGHSARIPTPSEHWGLGGVDRIWPGAFGGRMQCHAKSV